MVRLRFTDEFKFAQSEVTVRAIFGFTSVEPTFQLVDSQTIEISDLNALESGDQVKFTVSSI